MNYFDVKNKEVYICFGSGEKYNWQHGGVGCFKAIIKNPIFLGVSNSRVFDSDFWYSLSRFDGFVIPNFDWKVSFDEKFEKTHKNDLERANKSKKKITYEELFLEVVNEASNINKKFTNFKLVNEKMNNYNEAYVPVSFSYQNKIKVGNLIWKNCD